MANKKVSLELEVAQALLETARKSVIESKIVAEFQEERAKQQGDGQLAQKFQLEANAKKMDVEKFTALVGFLEKKCEELSATA
jgi:hypothetical protein